MNSAHLIKEHAKWELFLYPLFGPSFRHIRQCLKSISCQLKTNPYGGVLSQSVYVHPLPSNQTKKSEMCPGQKSNSHMKSGDLPLEFFLRSFVHSLFFGTMILWVPLFTSWQMMRHINLLPCSGVGWLAGCVQTCMYLAPFTRKS